MFSTKALQQNSTKTVAHLPPDFRFPCSRHPSHEGQRQSWILQHNFRHLTQSFMCSEVLKGPRCLSFLFLRLRNSCTRKTEPQVSAFPICSHGTKWRHTSEASVRLQAFVHRSVFSFTDMRPETWRAWKNTGETRNILPYMKVECRE